MPFHWCCRGTAPGAAGTARPGCSRGSVPSIARVSVPRASLAAPVDLMQMDQVSRLISKPVNNTDCRTGRTDSWFPTLHGYDEHPGSMSRPAQCGKRHRDAHSAAPALFARRASVREVPLVCFGTLRERNRPDLWLREIESVFRLAAQRTSITAGDAQVGAAPVSEKRIGLNRSARRQGYGR